jgi:hypothetical protein
MERFVALFICMMTVGCLRPVWAESALTPSRPAPESRNGTPPVTPEPVDDGIDTYRVTFDHMRLMPWRFTFYVDSEESYALNCHWQTNTCAGTLPTSARRSRAVLIGLPLRLCNHIRFFRDGEELVIEDHFRHGCGFMLQDPTESPP